MRKASPVFLAAALLAQPAPAFAEDGVVLDDQGIKATGLDGEVSLHVGGKLHLDAVAVDDGAGGYDDAGVRRARLNLRLDYRDVLTLRAEREFAGSKGWRNLYAQLRPARGAVIQAGQFNVPFSLEDLQSTNVIPFPERSLAAALTSEFGVGVMGGYGARRFTVRAGWFGDALDTPAGPAPSLGRGLVGRATVLAVDSGPAKLHLGLGLERRSFRAGEAVRYSADAGSSLGPRILRTPELGNLAHRTGYNAEIAFLRRNIAVQGQYIGQNLRQLSGAERRVAGGYAQASWLLTGQPYRYARGSGMVAGPDLSEKKTALELSGRISWLDARNASLDGGYARSLDLAAGLYLGRNFRLMLSGTQSRYRTRLGRPEETVLVAATRAQIAF